MHDLIHQEGTLGHGHGVMMMYDDVLFRLHLSLQEFVLVLACLRVFNS